MRYWQIRGIGVRLYLSDPWNCISAVSLVTYFIGLGLQHGQTIQYYEAARIFRALNFMSFAYQLIRYMTVLEIWGILIPVLHRMVSTYSAYFTPYIVCREPKFLNTSKCSNVNKQHRNFSMIAQ